VSGVQRNDGMRDWARAAALVCAYVASVAYSLFLAGATHNLPTIWTANAIAIGALMVLNQRQGLTFLAVTCILRIVLGLTTQDNLRFTLLITGVDAIQMAGTAYLLRWMGAPVRIRDQRGLLTVIVLACLLTVGTSILSNGLLTLSAGRPLLKGWSEWTISNVLGAAVALPATLILLDRRHREGFIVSLSEVVAVMVVVAAVSAVVFANHVDYQVLLFAPIILGAFRGGPQAVAGLVAVAIAMAIPAVLHRTGVDPAVALPPLRHALIFLVVLYAVGLVAALAISRQKRLKILLARRSIVARAAQARAQAANQAKSEFLATISHEIRTPLNSILGFASLVADDPGLSAESRRRLDLVGSAGRSLAEIVGDLLDFAKVEAGRLDLTLTPSAPAALLRDAADIIGPEAAAKGLYLRTEVETLGQATPDALLALDETRLRQVLLNLLANALKFTAEGGVTARLIQGPAPGALRFEIVDTGIGIAPEVQARLFQRFSQGDSSISRSYGGTGLGLAISKALVTRMGGEIGVDSQLGHGARFWIALTAQPAAAPDPADQVAPEILTERAPRVLLVDDHPMNRELGKALLTLAGCEVITAEDGVQAVEAVRVGDIDLVLMDVHMPGMDGLAATRAIRALPGPLTDVPIIALSADALPEQIARCRAAGMDDHVAKPIQREALIAAVAKALAKLPEGRDVAPESRTAH
jgi:signal transduction histidine kinase/CheY-like chemotaxis protein